MLERVGLSLERCASRYPEELTYIDVEAGVDARGGVVDVGPEVAAGGGGVGRVGEGAGGWID